MHIIVAAKLCNYVHINKLGTKGSVILIQVIWNPLADILFFSNVDFENFKSGDCENYSRISTLCFLESMLNFEVLFHSKTQGLFSFTFLANCTTCGSWIYWYLIESILPLGSICYAGDTHTTSQENSTPIFHIMKIGLLHIKLFILHVNVFSEFSVFRLSCILGKECP